MKTKRPHLLTAEGLEKLTAELEQLRKVGREEVAERLRQAFADGQDDDFVDNAELEAARNAQSFLEGRIQELEDILTNYQIIEEGKRRKRGEGVRVGDTVTVVENGFNEKETYHLVGGAEADPTNGRISNESPLGKALLGAKKGDIVRVKAPNGIVEFRVVKIS